MLDRQKDCLYDFLFGSFESAHIIPADFYEVFHLFLLHQIPHLLENLCQGQSFDFTPTIPHEFAQHLPAKFIMKLMRNLLLESVLACLIVEDASKDLQFLSLREFKCYIPGCLEVFLYGLLADLLKH